MLSRYARTTLGVASALVTVMSIAPKAQAYEAKRAPSGALVHWASTSVDFVVNPELDQVADGAQDAVTRALAGWEGVANAPSLNPQAGTDSVAVGYDGVNVIAYAPDGYEPAGGALAVTLLTYDDKTGVIVDADIVLNGQYSYALLDDSARAVDGTLSISTEGGGSIGGAAQFDLLHVFAHEAGHALGLSDEPSDATALMYPYTTPGDASSRLPAADDLAGVAVLYATPETPAATKSSQDPLAGCSVARAPHAGGAAPFLLAACFIAFPLVRRRTRGARAALLATGAFLTFAALPAGATISQATVPSRVAHVDASVTSSNVVVQNGVFRTELTLAVHTCPLTNCPAVTRTTVWGGHMGGVTQELAGISVPVVGQRVAVDLDETDITRARIVFANH